MFLGNGAGSLDLSINENLEKRNLLSTKDKMNTQSINTYIQIHTIAGVKLNKITDNMAVFPSSSVGLSGTGRNVDECSHHCSDITNVGLSGTGRNVDECSHHYSDR